MKKGWVVAAAHLIVQLQASEHGVLKADVHAHYMVEQRVCLVCFQR